jgi:hypothetical protein
MLAKRNRTQPTFETDLSSSGSVTGASSIKLEQPAANLKNYCYDRSLFFRQMFIFS